MTSLDAVNLGGADMSKTYLNGANLRGAELRGASLSGADLSRKNLTQAQINELINELIGTTLLMDVGELRGADVSEARNLTQAQINEANGNEYTKLPDHLQRPEHWIKREEKSEEG